MSKPNLKIVKSSPPERCEVCHQSDMFDRSSNYCSRCKGQKQQDNNIIALSKKDNQSAKEKNDILIAKYQKKNLYIRIRDFISYLNSNLLTSNNMPYGFKSGFRFRFREEYRYKMQIEFGLEPRDLRVLDLHDHIDLLERFADFKLLHLPIVILYSIFSLVLYPLAFVFYANKIFFDFLNLDGDEACHSLYALFSPKKVYLKFFYFFAGQYVIMNFYKFVRNNCTIKDDDDFFNFLDK